MHSRIRVYRPFEHVPLVIGLGKRVKLCYSELEVVQDSHAFNAPSPGLSG